MVGHATFGVVPLEQVRTMSGLELMTGLIDGRFPAPPIAGLSRGGMTGIIGTNYRGAGVCLFGLVGHPGNDSSTLSRAGAASHR